RMSRSTDLFMAPYPFTSKILVRISNTAEESETQPQAYKGNLLMYLSDKNGIYNRFVAQYDSAISFIDTTEHYRYFFTSTPVSNYDRNILEQHFNSGGTHVGEVIHARGKDMLLVTPVDQAGTNPQRQPANTWYRGNVSPALTDPEDFREQKND